jgi:L-threonylcarbamoyladenylate synthase
MIYTVDQINEIADELISGKIGVLPTDTIYGIHACATNFEAVEKIYTVKERDGNKPFIILVNSIDDVNNFGIETNSTIRSILEAKWPGPTTIVLPCTTDGYGYLHRGQFSLGFRYPNNQFLNKLLEISGPLVSTSANISGSTAVTDIQIAQQILGDKINFYVDGGRLIGMPSEVFKFENNELTKLR